MAAMQMTHTSTYFYKIRKVNDLPQFVNTRYSPDAWFLGNLGFRAYYVSANSVLSSKIKFGMYLSHCQCRSHLPCPVRGRISIVDLKRKRQTMELADETMGYAEDWAVGIEIGINLSDFKKYSIDGAYLIRLDVELVG